MAITYETMLKSLGVVFKVYCRSGPSAFLKAQYLERQTAQVPEAMCVAMSRPLCPWVLAEVSFLPERQASKSRSLNHAHAVSRLAGMPWLPTYPTPQGYILYSLT